VEDRRWNHRALFVDWGILGIAWGLMLIQLQWSHGRLLFTDPLVIRAALMALAVVTFYGI
jgi:hypothetical protein